MNELSHTNHKGEAKMADVSAKEISLRKAEACGQIMLQPETCRLIREDLMKKGSVLTVAQIAGISAAKDCARLIPLCHPLPLSRIDVTPRLTESGVEVSSCVVSTGRTGVEMEALTAVSVALLTVYDMCKAVDKTMTITAIHLVSKTKILVNSQ